MKISLIMGTLDRHELMVRAIKSVLNQTYKNFEIIIVDQSKQANNEIKKMSDKIKYFHVSKKGLSRARNFGLKYVTGEFVGLMDDDAEYEEHALENLVKLLKSNPTCKLVCGKIYDKEKKASFLRGMIEQKIIINKKNILKTCASAGMFINTQMLLDIGFDNNLGIGSKWGSGEETDVGLSILRKGGLEIYTPTVIIYHLLPEKEETALDKIYSYNLGFGALCAKHFFSCGDKYIAIIFFKALIKNIVAFCLSVLRLNKYMVKYYYSCIKGKYAGIVSYLKYTKNY